ncbi:MAG: pseudouridine-5'-phosphate glycosidase [Acidimicrobiales bacterium]|nr:pseudouridine-5'-phosphate glycosidase [Acidimicrobiales bacterium]
MTHPHLTVSDPVGEALHDQRAVVALESTIITHGMPYPRNVETALAVQAAITERGAVPATTAVMDGTMRVGLSDDEIDALGQAGDTAVKVSRRDLAFTIAHGSVGGTTVAATMMLAAMAGVRVFATGGIGGVHRGAGTSFDVSADLQELARTEVVVVCAGPKSILDLGLTLEYLETHGVPVIGFGTDMVPAFYSRESDFRADYRIDDAAGVAAVMAVRRDLGVGGGMLVTNPIPVEYGMERSVIDAAIDTAIAEADAQNIIGKGTSPFLLGRIVELTGGASLDANVQLVLNNARVAADIAIADRKGQVIPSASEG